MVFSSCREVGVSRGADSRIMRDDDDAPPSLDGAATSADRLCDRERVLERPVSRTGGEKNRSPEVLTRPYTDEVRGFARIFPLEPSGEKSRARADVEEDR